MLTVPQAGILELLGEVGCLRRRHVEQFAAAKYGSRPEHVGHMLRQLAMLGKVQANGGLVMLPGRKPDRDTLQAFDVAEELAGGAVDFAVKGGRGLVLVFSARGRTFGVAFIGAGMEHAMPARLREAAGALTVIYVLRDAGQRKYIQAAGNCYFAVQKENGGYRFFK